MVSIKELRKKCQTKGYSWYARLLMRISIYFTYFFIRLGVTANQVTLLSIVVGILGTLFFVYPNPVYWIFGWFIIQIHLLLDSVDGEVARYSKKI